jgi:FtsH-binding integral membrane protein
MIVGLVQRFHSLLAVALALLVSAAAHAQEAAAAPQPTLQKSPPVWLGLLVIFLMLAAVISVSLMPSRRTHLD